jgi:hypothetical protein
MVAGVVHVMVGVALVTGGVVLPLWPVPPQPPMRIIGSMTATIIANVELLPMLIILVSFDNSVSPVFQTY